MNVIGMGIFCFSNKEGDFVDIWMGVLGGFILFRHHCVGVVKG